MLTVREIKGKDISKLLDYWYQLTEEDLKKMGADRQKLPSGKQFEEALQNQISAEYQAKSSLALIWLHEAEPIGHCNVSDIVFGQTAKMHLHMWQSDRRKKGMGTELVKKSIPHFFDELELEFLVSEPYAHNPAPNRVLEKVGFKFEKKYVCTPGSINFEQEVNRWVLERKAFEKLHIDETKSDHHLFE